MTVLVLSYMFPDPAESTAGVFVLEQVKALRDLGVDVIVVSPRPWAPRLLGIWPRFRRHLSVARQRVVDGFVVNHPRFLIFPRSLLFSISGLLMYIGVRRLVRDYAKRTKIDVIHAHSLMPDGFAAVLCGRELNLPVVCTAHGSDINLYPYRSLFSLWATRWTLKNLSAVMSVSNHLKSKILSLVGLRQVEVVRNGADAELFVPFLQDEARTSLGLPLKERIVLFAGRLTDIKQIPVLLNAIRLLSRPEVQLYLVGDGELKTELITMAEQLGIAAQCRFVGAYPHGKMPLWFSAADCLVLCSRMEGLPTVLPEAMMCHIPIIASDVGGIPEIVKDRETGLLVPSGDAGALKNAIELVLADKNLVATVTTRAAAIAMAEHTWHANAGKTALVYQSALDKWQLSAVPMKLTPGTTRDVVR